MAVAGKKAPALTVASLAMTICRRPATRPTPQTTPAAGAPPYAEYISHADHWPTSKTEVPGSTSLAIRSREVSRPFLCWRAAASGPPPSSILATSAARRLRSSDHDVGAASMSVVRGCEGVGCDETMTCGRFQMCRGDGTAASYGRRGIIPIRPGSCCVESQRRVLLIGIMGCRRPMRFGDVGTPGCPRLNIGRIFVSLKAVAICAWRTVTVSRLGIRCAFLWSHRRFIALGQTGPQMLRS